MNKLVGGELGMLPVKMLLVEKKTCKKAQVQGKDSGFNNFGCYYMKYDTLTACPFCLVWSCITCFRPENVSCNWLIKW